jgi:hypothetical protein
VNDAEFLDGALRLGQRINAQSEQGWGQPPVAE